MSDPQNTLLAFDFGAGWAIWKGEPQWRSTVAALNRLTGADVYWLRHRGRRVAHLKSGTPVAVLRNYPATRRWSVNIEGFEFFGPNRVFGKDMWAGPKGFDRVAEAKAFTETVLRQAGAHMKRTPSPSNPTR